MSYTKNPITTLKTSQSFIGSNHSNVNNAKKMAVLEEELYTANCLSHKKNSELCKSYLN